VNLCNAEQSGGVRLVIVKWCKATTVARWLRGRVFRCDPDASVSARQRVSTKEDGWRWLDGDRKRRGRGYY